MSDIFRGYAADHGDEVALCDEFGETTWAQFDDRTNRLVNALRAAGLEAGDTFSLVAGNRREAFEAMAAASHGGWKFVPVNWHWVAEELAYVLANSDSRALLVDARFDDLAAETMARADAPELALRVVFGGPAPDGFADYEAVLAAASPDEPADQKLGGPMFYTSGTTGRPKGVVSSLLPPDAPVAAMKLVGAAIIGMLGIPEGGTTLLEGPVYHSAQWAFSYLPMLSGNSVVMRHKFDAAETLELIDRHRITNVHLVPTQFIRLLDVDPSVRAEFDGSSLVLVLHGAAPCPPQVKRQMIDWFGPIVMEYYGATEGAIISAIGAEDWLAKPGSLGKPLDHIEAIVVREDGSRAGVGEEGQLYFRNKRGSDFEYHKDPEKTAAAHLEPGIFTFGDIGYLDEDDHLFMSDRKIDMVISGGVNIYPAEIEGVLVSHPAVADAAVFGVPHSEMGEEVKAAVELVQGCEPGNELAAELIAHCREHLAGYKAPRSIDFEAKLPRHPTGKLYKRLLRDPYWAASGRRI
ncbi:MAG: AMP-binding protein [Deltaproteobacteria bacterium]|nr:AMP-binding protein [Deltaproteobacteria bacterium]MBW2400868.1 AMP-binding protein [Deltaproteobacteria bacterium]